MNELQTQLEYAEDTFLMIFRLSTIGDKQYRPVINNTMQMVCPRMVAYNIILLDVGNMIFFRGLPIDDMEEIGR